MFSDADESLTSLEESMLRIAREEIRKFEEAEDSRPLPMALVTLMDKAHKAVLAHLSKRSGMDTQAMMKNPRAALVQLDRQRAMLLKMIEQQESGKAKASNG